ncbi:galactose-1-epimerase [Thorsellia anophelis]|uniref:Aldose 1-epimerase n=1 Tax=Thorsellia anophelis DSM 18579 TaxID=1123402 RepID=A0A1I0CAC7_9GAMM|nr:galactose-1-epimerase [Thorsellia anophelis]SET15938.1 aldose 1-epimerase [Thorsellia anophelis DSM 18579]
MMNIIQCDKAHNASVQNQLIFDWLNADWTDSPWLDGKPAVFIPLLNSNGMSVVIMDIGATWLSCKLPIFNANNQHGREVVLRSPSMNEHIKQTAYFGAIIGRYSNRIANGQFSLSGKTYQLPQNQDVHSLHGGYQGFDKKRWRILETTPSSVLLGYLSPDGEEGYPGELSVTILYHLSDDNNLSITYEAFCADKTVVNLTNHAYFNLAGIESDKTVFEHQFEICADYYLPVDQANIPIGELRPVSGTDFDFKSLTYLKQEIDHTFIFNQELTNSNSVVAQVLSPDKDVTMVVKTTKPTAQFYTGNYLAGNTSPYGRYQRGSGFAIETQYIPDGPNQFGLGLHQGILPAKVHYHHTTSYGFMF